MATFGGITFNSNQDIADFVDSNSQDFISMVKSYSVLLANVTDQQIINKLLQESYPRIGMKLAAAKDLSNNYLFADSRTPSDWTALFLNVILVMTDRSSPFAEGLVSVAARYTAASFISALPLDTDIKNISLSKELHSQAHQDLHDIVELYLATGGNNGVNATTDLKPELQQSLYLSLAIDKTTLPASYFNVAPVKEIISDITSLYPQANVKTLSSLTLPPGFVGICELSITSSIAEYGDLIHNAFFVQTGDDTQAILETIASLINISTSSQQSNIIACPNSDSNKLVSTEIFKKKIYFDTDPLDPTGIYDKKTIQLTLLTGLDWLSFEARNRSPINNRELVIVNFYTVSRAAAALSINPLANYAGEYSALANYSINDVVTFRELDYICTTSSAGNSPSDVTYWTRLYEDANDLTKHQHDPTSKPYIEGLIYGLYNNYADLDSFGPLSLILDVNEGKVSSTIGVTDVNKNTVTTLYFRAIDPSLSINGLLKFRVSTAGIPEVQEFEVELVDARPEDLSLALVNKLFGLRALASRINVQGLEESVSETLGVLVKPAAVHITSFKYTLKVIKVVLDVGIDGVIPSNLEIATGDIFIEKTRYSPRPRSIIVEAEPEKQFTLLQSSLQNIDNNYVYAAGRVKMEKNSGAFQAAQDRIKLLQGRG